MKENAQNHQTAAARKRPGRAPGPPEEVRTARVPVLLSPTEYAMLADMARQQGVSMAELLRSAARSAGYLGTGYAARQQNDAR